MAKKVLFPKTVYVQRKMDEGGPFLTVSDTVDDAAEMGECVTVGVYQLVKVAKVVNASELVD